MSHSILYTGNNTHVLEVLGPDGAGGLQDHDGTVQTDATVTLQSLTDRRTGVAVEGVTVPITLSHVSAGLYQGTLPHGASLMAGRAYEGLFLAVGSQGYRAEWVETVIAQVRAE